MRSTNGRVPLILYAQPSTTNIIESATTLLGGGTGFGASVNFPNPITATNLVTLPPPLPATNRTLFLRAVRE